MAYEKALVALKENKKPALTAQVFLESILLYYCHVLTCINCALLKLEQERDACKDTFFKTGNIALNTLIDTNKELEIIYLTAVSLCYGSS
jgi:hypothetical protein